jgi:hypothetical protein
VAATGVRIVEGGGLGVDKGGSLTRCPRSGEAAVEVVSCQRSRRVGGAMRGSC